MEFVLNIGSDLKGAFGAAAAGAVGNADEIGADLRESSAKNPTWHT